MSSSGPRPSARAYGVALRDGAVLLVRASAATRAPGVWWLPGGGIDFGESPLDALVREFSEETGLVAREPTLLDVISDVHTRKNGEVVHSIRIIYRVTIDPGDLIHELDGTTDLARWVPLNELHELALAPYARRAIDLSI